jgi:hypothetical protein
MILAWVTAPACGLSARAESTTTMKDRPTPREPFVPPVLQWVLVEARRPWSAEEDEAGQRLILGQISLGEYLTVLHKARSRH